MIVFSLISTFVLFISLCNDVDSKILVSHCDKEGKREVLSCTSYAECENGQYVTKYCESGEKFDLDQMMCRSSGVFQKGCEYCDFKDKRPVKGSSAKYMVCDGGRLVVGECDNYFDRLSKECKQMYNFYPVNNNYISNSMVLESDSHCVPNKRVPIDGSCGSYMECDSTFNWVRHECSDCQHFEPSSMKCVWAWKYSCTPSPSTTSPTTSEPTTELTTSSASEEPTSTATSSYQPTTGTVTTAEPTTGVSTTENPTTTTDVPSTFTTPEPTSTVTTTTTTPEPTSTVTTTTTPEPTSTGTTAKSSTSTSSSTTSPTTTSSSTTTTKAPECTKEGQKKVFKAGDCKDYLECDSGVWVKKSCSFGYDFDVNKLECRWSWWAHC